MPMHSNEIFSDLLSDDAVRALFAPAALLQQMLAFERALTEALRDTGAVSGAAAGQALQAMDSFVPDVSMLGGATLRDGLPVPEWVRQLKAHTAAFGGDEGIKAVHVGGTSQDVLDTAMALILRQTNDLLDARMAVVLTAMTDLDSQFGDSPLMGRTRMQAALPVTMGDRIALWREPLRRHRMRLSELRASVEVAHFGGPVGTRATPAGQGDAVARYLAQHLGLTHQDRATHAMREDIVTYGHFLTTISGTLGKMGQDLTLMAQQGIDEVRLRGGGGSSAMPHKQNPIMAETLVTLARYNAMLSGGLAQCMIHEQERSGTAWTLEWMILPQIAEVTAAALKHSERLLGQVERLGCEPVVINPS